MSFLRMLAIVVIFITATVAWVILGSVTQIRTEDYSSVLSGRVSRLCGSQLGQKPPIFTAITELRQTVPSFKGTTTKKTGFWSGKTQIIKKQLSPVSNVIDVDLKLEYRKKGLIWFPVYKCKFAAEYTLENISDAPMEVKAHFDFPSASATYDDFLLKVEGVMQECQINTQSGIDINFEVKAKSQKIFSIYYKTRGLYSWSYLPENSSGGRLRNLKMTVNTDFKEIDFQDDSLSPGKLETTDSGCRMVWNASNLITSKPISITMPERLNPGPLVTKVTFFAPFCLLFFFVVLLSVTVIRKVNIHPMHFMFTAAGFFAFNLLFAYLVDVINVHISFLLASIVTLVLVNSYQRAALGEKFPWKWVGLAQFCYLILFSYSFFFKGLTGLTVTIGSIITLAVLMYLTRHIDWNQTFKLKTRKKEQVSGKHETKSINN